MDRFDRQRKIFGDKGQKQLRASKIGVVGAGGLGSFVVLELAYLGVGSIVIVDHDLLDDSNRNRLVGAWESHTEGTPKVELLRDLVRRIDVEVETLVVRTCVEDPEAETFLAGVDVVMACLDNDGPRSVLNKFCCKQGLPLIDSASDTMPETDQVIFGGRVCVATADTGCLLCFGVLNQDEIADYFATPKQRADREELYGVGRRNLAGAGPAVITVNGVIASIAVTELMVLLTGIRAPIGQQEWRGHEGIMRPVRDHGEGCYFCALRSMA